MASSYKRLEKQFNAIVEQLHSLYPFLDDVTIEVLEGYGIKGVTSFRSDTQSIYIDLIALKKLFKTPRFEKRFGKVKTFNEFVLMTLLHEIAHVEQYHTVPDHRINATIRESDYQSEEGHDECWFEKDADTWARKEFITAKRLLKVR